jgi:hypothetical protein
VASINRPAALYLDQKDWIALARLRTGKRCPDGFREVAIALTVRISTGDVFTPLSESHFLETRRISNPKQRQDVATNMLIISRRHALAPLHHLWPQEADVFFRLHFGAATDAEPEPFGKGWAFALGYPDELVAPWPATASEADIALAEMFAVAEPDRSEMSDAETERERRRDEWAKVMTEAADSLVKDRTKYNEQDRLAAATVQMLDRGGLIDRAIALDVQEPFLDFVRQEGFWAVVRTMPTLAVLTELLRLRYPNVSEPWKVNDYNDIRFLSVALAYCSAVCCDNHWGDLARRSEYIASRSVVIATGELAIASALDGLGIGGTTPQSHP